MIKQVFLRWLVGCWEQLLPDQTLVRQLRDKSKHWCNILLVLIIIIFIQFLPDTQLAQNQFVFSLFRSENIQSWIFLQNSHKNKLWMLHYLLYIIIQKWIPAMGCLDAVLEMREAGSHDWKGGSSGRDFTGLCCEGFCLQCLSSYCCISCRAEHDTVASRQKQNWALGEGCHHEEGAPTLLFLMVASEPSASDESQSESPNCSGFWGGKKKHTNIKTDPQQLK